MYVLKKKYIILIFLFTFILQRREQLILVSTSQMLYSGEYSQGALLAYSRGSTRIF